MIQYKVDRAALISEINKESPSGAWWRKAKKAFDQAVLFGTHDADKEYWSEIKEAYMRLQNHKCAYCETPMAQGRHAKIDYDVEHHRPKGKVDAWPTQEIRRRLSINYTVASGRVAGYPELAHHPHNYVVSCKVCNSPYKSNFFPILGTPSKNGECRIARLNSKEKPVIPLPMGDWGEDPEQILTFLGFVAIPASDDPASVLRAKVIIDFFELNLRPDLLLGRATAIYKMYHHLCEVKDQRVANDSAEAQRWVLNAMADSAPYSAACRAYYRLYQEDSGRAKEIARLSQSYVEKKDPVLAESLLFGAAP